MPTYSYRRKDGTLFEIEQKITEPALHACPTTGQSVTRVITGGAGLVFKGTGFYVTDYARNGSNGSSSSASADSSTKTADDKASAKPEKSDAAKASPEPASATGKSSATD